MEPSVEQLEHFVKRLDAASVRGIEAIDDYNQLVQMTKLFGQDGLLIDERVAPMGLASTFGEWRGWVAGTIKSRVDDGRACVTQLRGVIRDLPHIAPLIDNPADPPASRLSTVLRAELMLYLESFEYCNLARTEMLNDDPFTWNVFAHEERPVWGALAVQRAERVYLRVEQLQAALIAMSSKSSSPAFDEADVERVRDAMDRVGWDAKSDVVVNASKPIRRVTALRIRSYLLTERSRNSGTSERSGNDGTSENA